LRLQYYHRLSNRPFNRQNFIRPKAILDAFVVWVCDWELSVNVSYSAVLQKYWFSILMFALTAASFASPETSLLSAFLFTFLVPGLIFSRFFNLSSYEILAFVPIISVLVSTQLVYFVSLLLGYSKETVLLTFLVLTVIYTLVTFRKGEILIPKGVARIKQVKKTTILVFCLIFAIALIVLLKSVWSTNQYGIVLTGSNWQDTPLHYEIIEGVNNGNFPPQMSYYAGNPMTYHYFVDFHTAILEKVYGFLPTLLPFLNAVFIGIFGLSVYALAREYGRRAAIISAIIAVFGAGFSYYGLFSALVNGQFSSYTNYMYQYGQFFGLPPIFDNLLQQRPLLIGLPLFTLVLLLLRNMENKNRLLLAGVLTGLVYQFHNVSFFCCYVAYFIALILNLKRFKFSYLYFVVPSVLALPFIFSGGLSGSSFQLSVAFPATFAKVNPLAYYIANLGVPFLIALISFAKKGSYLLKGALITMILIPNLFLLTPNAWDMYKFFIFAWIPIAVLSGALLAKTKKGIAMLLIVISVLAAVSVVAYNVGTDYGGASWDEYHLGMWVRSNTPERSVFLTYYSIHCPPAMIGGRIVVSSYFNWAYGHGVPLDDIFRRGNDIDRAFNGTETDLKEVVQTYNVSYVYVGNDELQNYPGCVNRFSQITWLQPVYTIGLLYIYQVDLPQNG
jgi:hypothetical protein